MRFLGSPCSCSHQTLLRERKKKVKSGIQNRLGPLQCIWEPWHPLAAVTHKVEGTTLIYMILLDHFSPVNNTSCIRKKRKTITILTTLLKARTRALPIVWEEPHTRLGRRELRGFRGCDWTELWNPCSYKLSPDRQGSGVALSFLCKLYSRFW